MKHIISETQMEPNNRVDNRPARLLCFKKFVSEVLMHFQRASCRLDRKGSQAVLLQPRQSQMSH